MTNPIREYELASSYKLDRMSTNINPVVLGQGYKLYSMANIKDGKVVNTTFLKFSI